MKHEGKVCSWYGPGGALVTMDEVPGVTTKLDEGAAKYYHGSYMIAESMSISAARTISDALGLYYMGRAT